MIRAEKAQKKGFRRSLFGWDTRTRTLNNRTRICCVANYTISQSLLPFLLKSGAKLEYYFETSKTFADFFKKIINFAENLTKTRFKSSKKDMRPLILISNDDGYDAMGITTLIEMVRDMGDVIVVAPDGARSGSSLAITNTVPVRYAKVREEEGLTVYSCSGTPCDCVKMALENLVPRRPDLVLGGINHGDNAATNAHYSGTIGVAIEGTLKGIPSIGFSSCAYKKKEDFERLADAVRSLTGKVLEKGLPEKVFLNVNFPKSTPMKGMRVCRMGMGDWVNEWVERDHPRGGTYFWIAGDFKSFDGDDPQTDIWALDHGYTAITPITLDFTAYSTFSFINEELGIRNEL